MNSDKNPNISIRKSKPRDYHCKCGYCIKLYRGELRKKDGTYFSGRTRDGYSPLEKEKKHLCRGHFIGYKFAIEKYTKPGDVVLDPCAGTGTAVVEAAKLKRFGIGIELEYPDVLKANSKLYPDWSIAVKGDAREKIDQISQELDLIITGPTYNNGSDRPERKNLEGEDLSFDYKNKDSFAFLKDADYFKEMGELYRKSIYHLKKGGHFVMIIKDPIRNKSPYLLHHLWAKELEKMGMKVVDVWIHRHWPPTLFMSTYSKRFPEVKIPLYQTLIVLKKVKE